MSNDNRTLADRMKEDYENRNKPFLTRRVPVIIRLDGRSFSSLTRGFERPFDSLFRQVMKDTMLALCKNIQGCKLGYTQSDEISLLLTDYDNPKTDAWFNYNLEKIVSISASMATAYFNLFFNAAIKDYQSYDNMKYNLEMDKVYTEAIKKIPMFDSRAFNIPKEEVCNYFIFRQQDCTRNSIQSVGQTYFSPKQLNGVNCDQIQDMLFTEKGINWNDFSTANKRGSCCVRKQGPAVDLAIYNGPVENVTITYWEVDNEIPIFTQDRDYIDQCL